MANIPAELRMNLIK